MRKKASYKKSSVLGAGRPAKAQAKGLPNEGMKEPVSLPSGLLDDLREMIESTRTSGSHRCQCRLGYAELESRATDLARNNGRKAGRLR